MRLNFDQIAAQNIFPGESGGDYGALLGYQNRPGGLFEGIDLTNMTVDEAIQFASGRGPYARYSRRAVGRTATPMGAYQIVGTTLRGLRDSGRISGDQKLTRQVQDYLGEVILETQGSGAWEAWRGEPVRPGQYQAPATFEEYKVQRGFNVPDEFIQATEAAGRVQPFPVDTELPGLFDMQALPGVDGGRPTQRQGIPVARRDNPANPTFADNAVGPLVNRQTRPTPRTVQEFFSGAPAGALLPGGPAERALNPGMPSATAAARAGMGPALNVSGQISVPRQLATTPQERSQVANARVELATQDARSIPGMQPSQGLTLFGQQEPELASLAPSGPPRRLGPRRIDPVQQRIAGIFDLDYPMPGDLSVAATTAQPTPQTTVTPEPRAPQSPLTPLEPARTVTQRQVAAPQGPRLDLVQGAAPSVAESVRSYGLFGDAGPGASYGYSPWGSGVARVYDNAPERVRIAASGPGLFGAFNDEFGTDIGIGPGRMMSPLTMALTAGLAAAGAGPLALAVPAASLLGAPQAAVNRIDVVPQSQRPQQQQPGLMQRLFSGNPLQGFAGGLFDAQPTQQSQQGSGEVTFDGPIGRNPTYVGENDLSAAAQAAIDRATRGLY